MIKDIFIIKKKIKWACIHLIARIRPKEIIIKIIKMESRTKQRKNENECVRRKRCIMDVYLSFKATNRRVIFREKSDRTGAIFNYVGRQVQGRSNIQWINDQTRGRQNERNEAADGW